MIKTELITIDECQLRRTLSDAGFMIERDGAVYSEAVDPVNTNRMYVETDVPIEAEVEAQEQPLSAEEAMDIILGGEA